MIKKIIVENWKSYRYAELPLDPLTILIGNNASGKSNLIEALEYLSRISRGYSLGSPFQDNLVDVTPLRGSIELLTFQRQRKFSLSAIVQGNSSQEYTYKIVISPGQIFSIQEESLVCNTDDRNLFKVEKPGYGLAEQRLKIKIGDPKQEEPYVSSRSLFRGERSILSDLSFLNPENQGIQKLFDEIKEVTLILISVFTLSPSPERMRGYSHLSDVIAADASNIAGVLSMQSSEQAQEFKNLMTRYFHNSQEGDIREIWAEPVGRLKEDAMLYCREQWPGSKTFEVDARSMSDGTLRFVAILTALLTRPKGSQLIIEDIDNGLHPTRFKQLLAMLKEIGEKREIDVLVTTHNPGFLDELDPELIPFTVVCHRDSETGESKLTLLEEIDHFAKLFASASLGKLAIQGAIDRGAERTK
ncbi:AAA family ATPase [Oscillatoria sp. FACHB-1406]|uniref:AAA family ATPase n=1 Tax=Oscillatoria sp. FACHB-1406 TaxID=2692846 RepID=UPI0016871D5C|nr:AAA family ATPase [Oscillatoria sp. FACHB-1406]